MTVCYSLDLLIIKSVIARSYALCEAYRAMTPKTKIERLTTNLLHVYGEANLDIRAYTFYGTFCELYNSSVVGVFTF
jgi:hypothetical protein